MTSEARLSGLGHLSSTTSSHEADDVFEREARRPAAAGRCLRSIFSSRALHVRKQRGFIVGANRGLGFGIDQVVSPRPSEMRPFLPSSASIDDRRSTTSLLQQYSVIYLLAAGLDRRRFRPPANPIASINHPITPRAHTHRGSSQQNRGANVGGGGAAGGGRGRERQPGGQEGAQGAWPRGRLSPRGPAGAAGVLLGLHRSMLLLLLLLLLLLS